ncbi:MULTISPECIES: cell division protein ZapA [Niveibacterium]|uniref:Cell division protein ZapA n=1 Tax=Niveibacterium microcysteis TaxID=2811415 RepID=A0ABX7M8D6_9RHOO|nr:cell division protein ZapA [Niveibacterium microcysteis]QSI77669.1 cell division protein ZapA [Niveibacterium microcysteis]
MTESVDFSVLGREYSVSVKPEERDSFLAAVALVDAKMREFDARTKASSDTLAVMTAINIAHELVQLQSGAGLDLPGYRRRMTAMGERIDAALAQQEKLF